MNYEAYSKDMEERRILTSNIKEIWWQSGCKY